ncbi:D-alanyl-D-alanine carboxypeptidase family protein [uncultured Ruthenibacterium sp.]|uniref:M15 family metallopeptidase n=1 Tax=uncultured Ruthenibacterium sp. TaxID=1905347 RepID=UPI00349E7E94
MPNPNIDFFSGEPENGTGANGNDKPTDSTFAGMQELNLFDDAPQTEQGVSDATQVFSVNQPKSAQPVVSNEVKDKNKEKNIGEMVFQSLFAEEESSQPVAEDAIPLDFAQPSEPTQVVEPEATEQEPIAVEIPQTVSAPAKPTGSVPVFNSTNRQEPLRRQVKAKPIDWNLDHFRQAQSQPAVAVPPQPSQPVQQPAMTSAPIEPVQTQPVQPQENPAWKQLLDQAIAEQKGTPAQSDGEAATRVFDPMSVAQPEPQPMAPVQPVTFEEQTELNKTAAFDFDAQPPLQEEPKAENPVISQTIPLDFEQPKEPEVQPIAFDTPLEPIGEPQKDDLGGMPSIDFSAFDQAVSAASEAEYGAEPQNGKEDVFADLYDGDPDYESYYDDDEEEEERPKRSRKGGSDGGKGGNKLPLFIGIALVVLVLVVLLFTKLLGGDKESSSQSSSLSSGTSDLSGVSSDVSTPAEPAVEAIPKDEWYMRLVNRDNLLTKEEADAISTTDVGGVPVDSRVAEAFNQLIAAAKDAGYTLTMKAGYRTYDAQNTNYNAGYTDCPAGASEHNLGLSADLFTGTVSSYDDAAYRASNEYKWLQENAANYGFIERYPEGSKDKTGFDPEPWHWRYVGVDQAQKIKASGLTFEEYLAQDSSAAPSTDATSSDASSAA